MIDISGTTGMLCTPLDLHSSQTYSSSNRSSTGFVPLWIYTALKRRAHGHVDHLRFVPLWIYTALKRGVHRRDERRALYPSGFTQLSNFQDAQERIIHALYPSGFTQLSNLIWLSWTRATGFVPLWIYTALKLAQLGCFLQILLCTPLDLHSSQTPEECATSIRQLCTPLDLHSSQTIVLQFS